MTLKIKKADLEIINGFGGFVPPLFFCPVELESRCIVLLCHHDFIILSSFSFSLSDCESNIVSRPRN